MEKSSKLKIGEKENIVQNNARACMIKVDNSIKVINGVKKLKKKELNHLKKIQVMECSEKSIVKILKSKCQRAANFHIIMWMEDIMKKSKQAGVRFVENQKKGLLFITRMRIERIMKQVTLLLFAISVIVKYIFQTEDLEKTWRGD